MSVTREQATHVQLQCFFCDHWAVRRLDSLPFDQLCDYQCPKCRRTGTTHVVRVQTNKMNLRVDASARSRSDRRNGVTNG
jgi:hypothetical protein